MKLFKKYKLKRNEESEFFGKVNYNQKISQFIKYDKIPNQSLSNYKKLTEVNKKLDAKAAAKKEKK